MVLAAGIGIYQRRVVKFPVRERLFDIGDELRVTDEQGAEVLWVDGRALRVRTTSQLKDPGARSSR